MADFIVSGFTFIYNVGVGRWGVPTGGGAGWWGCQLVGVPVEQLSAAPDKMCYNRTISFTGRLYMAEILLDEGQLKEILKKAILEIIKEEKEIFYDLLTEVLEDMAIEKAIKEGENTEPVAREAIFKMLDRQK